MSVFLKCILTKILWDFAGARVVAFLSPRPRSARLCEPCALRFAWVSTAFPRVMLSGAVGGVERGACHGHQPVAVSRGNSAGDDADASGG